MTTEFIKVTDKRHGFGEKDLKKILDAAASDPFLGSFIYSKKLKDMVLFVYNGKLVGFAIPRKDSDGHYRTGPIFVDGQYRGKGIAKEFISQYFQGKKGRAWIEKTNKASQATFTSAGFKNTNKVHVDSDGTVLYEYIKSE